MSEDKKRDMQVWLIVKGAEDLTIKVEKAQAQFDSAKSIEEKEDFKEAVVLAIDNLTWWEKAYFGYTTAERNSGLSPTPVGLIKMNGLGVAWAQVGQQGKLQ